MPKESPAGKLKQNTLYSLAVALGIAAEILFRAKDAATLCCVWLLTGIATNEQTQGEERALGAVK